MIYTPLTKKAMCICFEAHKNQTDKSGVPYVFHPWHLAEQMHTEYEVCTALLHDVLEDTDMTPDDLRQQGFPEEVITALLYMTHEDGVPYMDYVKKIRENPIAAAVKKADLAHNSDLTRFAGMPLKEKDWIRKEKYRKAMELLEE